MNTVALYLKIYGIKVKSNSTPLKTIAKFPLSELKSRFRKLAKANHSDRGGNDDDFRIVKEAYEFLKQYCLKDDRKDFKGIDFIKFGNDDGIWSVGEENFRKKQEYKTKQKKNRYLFYGDGSVYDTKTGRWVMWKGHSKWHVRQQRKR